MNYYIILLLLVSGIYAKTLQKTPLGLKTTDTKKLEKVNITYEQAKLFFKNKKYQKAYDAFYALFLNDLKNPNINFYLGRSASMLKKFEIAISAYERVLNFNKNATRAKLEIAKCYFELKDYKKSKAFFLNALKDKIPVNVKKNIHMYLKTIATKDKKNFVNGAIVLGVNYDTNIYNRANDDIFTIPGIIDTTTKQPIKAKNSTKDASGFAHQEAFSLNHRYKVNDTMKIKNNFVLFSKSIANNHKNDIALVQYSPALSVIYKKKFLVDYALLFNKIWVHSKPFMTNYAIYPKLKYIYSSSTTLGSGYKYQIKKTDTLRAQDQTLKFHVKNIYSNSLMFMFYGQFFSEKRLSGSLSNVNYNMFNFYLSSSYKYKPTLTFTPKVQWYTKTYKDKNIFYLKKQKDHEYQLSLNTTYSYSKSILLSCDYVYTKHTSNIPSWEFNKQSVTTNVIFLF